MPKPCISPRGGIDSAHRWLLVQVHESSANFRVAKSNAVNAGLMERMESQVECHLKLHIETESPSGSGLSLARFAIQMSLSPRGISSSLFSERTPQLRRLPTKPHGTKFGGILRFPMSYAMVSEKP